MNFDFTDVINFPEDKNDPEISYRTNYNIKNISNNRLFGQTEGAVSRPQCTHLFLDTFLVAPSQLNSSNARLLTTHQR